MDKINIIISCLLTTISIIITVSCLSDEKLTLKNILIFSLIFIPLSLISCIYFDGISRITMNILIIFISLYYSIILKDVTRALYYSLTYEILAFIMELFICLVEILVFKFDQSSYEQLPFAMTLTSIINIIGIYIVSNIKYFKKIINRFYVSISNHIGDWIYIIMIVISMILLMTFNRYNFSLSLSYLINVIMIIFVLLTIIYLVYSKIKSDQLENKYTETMEYVSKYEKIINEQGKKNHEFNNQLMVIKGYLDNKEKLKEYLNLVIEDHKCGQNYMIKQLGILPDGGIKGLIYHKLSKMEDCNIKPYLYIDNDIKDIFETKLDINTYKDITKLLGVFLDNAIEATKETSNKEIEFEIRKEGTCIIITISNTFNNNQDISQIGKKGFSTKGYGHGFGLSIVKDISKKNKNIETFNDIQEDKFIQTIIVYYK